MLIDNFQHRKTRQSHPCDATSLSPAVRPFHLTTLAVAPFCALKTSFLRNEPANSLKTRGEIQKTCFLEPRFSRALSHFRLKNAPKRHERTWLLAASARCGEFVRFLTTHPTRPFAAHPPSAILKTDDFLLAGAHPPCHRGSVAPGDCTYHRRRCRLHHRRLHGIYRLDARPSVLPVHAGLASSPDTGSGRPDCRLPADEGIPRRAGQRRSSDQSLAHRRRRLHQPPHSHRQIPLLCHFSRWRCSSGPRGSVGTDRRGRRLLSLKARRPWQAGRPGAGPGRSGRRAGRRLQHPPWPPFCLRSRNCWAI